MTSPAPCACCVPMLPCVVARAGMPGAGDVPEACARCVQAVREGMNAASVGAGSSAWPSLGDEVARLRASFATNRLVLSDPAASAMAIARPGFDTSSGTCSVELETHSGGGGRRRESRGAGLKTWPSVEGCSDDMSHDAAKRRSTLMIRLSNANVKRHESWPKSPVWGSTASSASCNSKARGATRLALCPGARRYARADAAAIAARQQSRRRKRRRGEKGTRLADRRQRARGGAAALLASSPRPSTPLLASCVLSTTVDAPPRNPHRRDTPAAAAAAPSERSPLL